MCNGALLSTMNRIGSCIISFNTLLKINDFTKHYNEQFSPLVEFCLVINILRIKNWCSTHRLIFLVVSFDETLHIAFQSAISECIVHLGSLFVHRRCNHTFYCSRYCIDLLSQPNNSHNPNNKTSKGCLG